MTVEWHRPLALQHVTPGGHDARFSATPAECAALAVRLRVPAVNSAAARFRLTPEPGGTVLAEARVKARVVRTCVVTLEDFESVVMEAFRVRFVPAGMESTDDDPEAVDEIPYSGAVIDLGEAAAEQLALALDPYPRAPGAVLPMQHEDDALPLAALASRRLDG